MPKRIKVPSEFRRGRLREFYADGYDYGIDVGEDWTTGSQAEQTAMDLSRRPHLGEFIGDWLSGYQQYADTIYYDQSVTERQLEAWESGLHDGITSVVEPWAEELGIQVY